MTDGEKKWYSVRDDGVHYPVPVFTTVNEGRCLTSQEFKEIYDMVMAGEEPVLPAGVRWRTEETDERD